MRIMEIMNRMVEVLNKEKNCFSTCVTTPKHQSLLYRREFYLSKMLNEQLHSTYHAHF
jgi:hypothetical protein